MWTANLGDCGCGTRLQIVTRPANRRALRSPSAPDLPEGPLQCLQRIHPMTSIEIPNAITGNEIKDVFDGVIAIAEAEVKRQRSMLAKCFY